MEYRLYSLDQEGRIDLARWIEAETDNAAVVRARELRPHPQKCEIWLSNRLVAKVNSAGRLALVEP